MKIRMLIPIFFIGLMIACTPATKLENSWMDPSLTSGTVKSFTKVLVVAALKDESAKRIAEDKIAAQFKPGIAIQSYTYLDATDTDQKQVEAKLKKDGFDGVVLMRLKDVEKSATYTPGTAYGGWYGYRNITPGYYTENKTFIVETNFYSLAKSKLLWTGTTSTLNPTKLENTIDQIIATIKFELQKKGLL